MHRARASPSAIPERPRVGFGHHGGARFPAVHVEAYNAELRDSEGFIGDRASNRAFRSILVDLRVKLRLVGDDPLGDTASLEISKKALDKLLLEGEPEAAGLVHGAIEGFAVELATVTGRFLRMRAWKEAKRIVVGGGLRASRVGELAIGRASVLLKGNGNAARVHGAAACALSQLVTIASRATRSRVDHAPCPWQTRTPALP